MGGLHALLLVAASIAEEGGAFGRWANLSDVRAGDISLTGLSAVFVGLLILFGFMSFLAYLFHGRNAAAAADPGREPVEDPSKLEERSRATVDPEPEDLPFTLPETPITMVPASLISGATLALHLFDKGELALGEPRRFEVDGIPRTVTLLAAGFMNRARVDGEEVAFSLTRVAPDETA